MKKKLFQIGFILLLAILVSTGINFSLKKNQSNFSLGVANIEALATGEIDVNFHLKKQIIFIADAEIWMEVVQDVLELTPSLYAEIVIKDQQRCYVKIGKVIVNSKIC